MSSVLVPMCNLVKEFYSNGTSGMIIENFQVVTMTESQIEIQQSSDALKDHCISLNSRIMAF